MRSTSALVIAVFAVACTSFGSSKDEPAPGPSPTPSSTAPSGADGGSPAPGTDAGGSSDSGNTPRPLHCGANTCASGQTCCVQSSAATCGDEVCNGGWRFQCFSADDCPVGTVCCNQGKVVTCATSCVGGEQICESGDECESSNCQTDACGSNEAYGVCQPKTAAIKPLCF